ncbi:LURP-one-related/scramblase family protein [Pinibacter aurantiacus]|uniref:Uncharacterized protein n=1 Tax=Pinibacter aurantiacus TaxID=2851599 RepID=A0A9E2S9J3_9BACT|nr:hypothetical protein [Pinibacter aurantiacus]MBV4358077.1 hypothetical protein [Pinibacter aurantiacus]
MAVDIDYKKFFNQYKVCSENGEFFASIVHEKSRAQKFFDFFLIDKTNSYAFKITSADGNTLASVHRSNAIWQKRFNIFDKNNSLVYTICPKSNFKRISFNVINSNEMHVAKIVGNSANTSFAMHDVYNHVVAIINKKNVHDTFCATEFAKMFDKNVLLATAICVGLYTGA